MDTLLAQLWLIRLAQIRLLERAIRRKEGIKATEIHIAYVNYDREQYALYQEGNY